MLRIACPFCGLRDETEFRYRGDATVVRPEDGGSMAEAVGYVFARDNPRGWHTEWWLHVGGCRQVLKLARHTVTHEIAGVGRPGDDIPLPGGAAS